MSIEENKALVLKFYETFDQQDIEKARSLISTNIIAQGLDVIPLEGFDAVMKYGAMMFAAFPDGHHHIDEVIAEEEKVFTRGIFTGTHRGDFMGIPATGQYVHFSVVHVDRIEHGKVIEHWGQGNTLALMKQLGIIHLPGPSLIPHMLRSLLSKLMFN